MSPLALQSSAKSKLHIDWSAISQSDSLDSQEQALRWLRSLPSATTAHIVINNPSLSKRRSLRTALQSLGCTVTLTFACIPQ